MIRNIVEIDRDKCNGCGACAKACHEHAIIIEDGKAVLIKDDYCDGLGDCLPACPTDAISIIKRDAAEYDEEAVKARIAKSNESSGCVGSKAKTIVHKENISTYKREESISQLSQWPVQIKLLPVTAPYYNNAKLLIAADCTAYAYASFHEDFIKNYITVIGCPKLDAVDYSEKLEAIISNNNIKSIKVVRMEVPCCGGLENAAIKALKNSGKMIPWQVVTISCEGKIISD